MVDALRRPLAGGAGRALSQLGGRRLSGLKQEVTEFPVEFERNVPEATPDSGAKHRERAAAARARGAGVPARVFTGANRNWSDRPSS